MAFSPLSNPLSRAAGMGSPLGVTTDLGAGDALSEQAAQEILARRKRLLTTPAPTAFGAGNGFGVQNNPGSGRAVNALTAGILGNGGF